jgi:hypothetical protein
MGNGALPHGPSDRAHPRLYRKAATRSVKVGFEEVGERIAISDIRTQAG